MAEMKDEPYYRTMIEYSETRTEQLDVLVDALDDPGISLEAYLRLACLVAPNPMELLRRIQYLLTADGINRLQKRGI